MSSSFRTPALNEPKQTHCNGGLHFQMATSIDAVMEFKRLLFSFFSTRTEHTAMVGFSPVT